MSSVRAYVMLIVLCVMTTQTSGQISLAELEVRVVQMETACTQIIQTVNPGVVYTRWGKGTCPNATETIYTGVLGGSPYQHSGGAANHLCLPSNPVYDLHSTPIYHTLIYGGEYETYPESTFNMNPRCAKCRTPRMSLVTIPSANTCPPGWTQEYKGYLMSGHYYHNSATEYICVDSSMEYVPGSQANTDGRLLYYAATACGTLACPPYFNNRVVICVVCSK